MGAERRDLLGSDSGRRGVAAVDLYWLPLGAGGHFVRLNGRIYEALAARVKRRAACDLYHSALQVEVDEGTFVIEQTPSQTRAPNGGASSPKAPSAAAGQADFGSFATRSAFGLMDACWTLPRP